MDFLEELGRMSPALPSPVSSTKSSLSPWTLAAANNTAPQPLWQQQGCLCVVLPSNPSYHLIFSTLLGKAA